MAVISWLPYPFYISLSHQKSILYAYIYIYYIQCILIVADIPIISPDGFDIVQVSRTYAYIYIMYIHSVFVMYIIIYCQIAYSNYDPKKDRQVNITIFVRVHFSILFPGLHRIPTCTQINDIPNDGQHWYNLLKLLYSQLLYRDISIYIYI